jgi:hypothetical protein
LHDPAHAVAQQTFETQKPVAQSPVCAHVAPLLSLKVAVTVVAFVTTTVQVVVSTLVHPTHDEKDPVAAGEATSWTLVPCATSAEHV